MKDFDKKMAEAEKMLQLIKDNYYSTLAEVEKVAQCNEELRQKLNNKDKGEDDGKQE